MEAFSKFEHLKIQLEEIKSTTNNFNDEKNKIGGGAFGKVYKGALSRYKERGVVAFKRLNLKSHQGEAEFLKEITTLSLYRHENLISLLGYCKEGKEMILVYEYASLGSLDQHINSPDLMWTQRLKICLDATKGLSYLHDKGTHQRIIHCDIKSSNILLDDQWNAKVSDFGLSKMAPANEQQSFLVTGPAGTPGYCDPQYVTTYTLTKESDVYSFGVVLFEVLCGTLCCKYSNGQIQVLVPTWIESYKQNKLNEIIFRGLSIKPMDVGSLKIFSDIAYRCLSGSREDRPTMAEVVKELEIALKTPEISNGKKPQINYQEMIKTAIAPLKYRSEAELMIILSQGVLLNGSKTWFTLDKNGEHCEMICIAECLSTEFERDRWTSKYNSKFAVGSYKTVNGQFKAHVRTQFLSPLIKYTVNLVFKFVEPEYEYNRTSQMVGLNYKLEGETKYSVSYLWDAREDGWLMLELYQFTSDQKVVDLEILFCGSDLYYDNIIVEGIEFRPVEKMEHKVSRDVQTVSDSDENWEEKLPADYEDIIKWSKDSMQMQWTTKKELYSILCNGISVNDGQEWFSLDQNGMKCLMLSARASCAEWDLSTWLSLPKSRFGGAIQLSSQPFNIVCKIKSQALSSATTYASYLVYKLPQDQSAFKAPVKVWKEVDFRYIYLVTHQTPVIRPKANQNTHNPLNRPRIKAIPQQRSDGWMEVQVWEFQTGTTTEVIMVNLNFTAYDYFRNLLGLIVQGIEFRPV